MALSAGTRLGPYEVLSSLGAGGMGEVYRARDARLGREVAIKVLPSDFATDPDRLRRFEQEARAVAALNHPNILALHDIGQHGGAPFIVTELLEGETLRDRLQETSARGAGSASSWALPLRTAIDYAVQIAHGLAAAHGKGIVHRDLKPENIFVTSDGRVKVLDFGLARLVQPGAETGSVATIGGGTGAGVVLGTVGYMSPEQVRGQPVDHRSDIFAFGAILYEMLAGRRAFHGASSADTMSAILSQDPPAQPLEDVHVPSGFARVVDRCLDKRPEGRFQSAHDLAFALEALSSRSEATAAAVVGGAHPRRLHLWVVAAATLVLAAASALAMTFYGRIGEPLGPIRFPLPPPDNQNFFQTAITNLHRGLARRPPDCVHCDGQIRSPVPLGALAGFSGGQAASGQRRRPAAVLVA